MNPKQTIDASPPQFVAVQGLTLRDLFAMAALLGLTASGDSGGAKLAAMDAYEFADAMLDERKENQG